MIASPEWLNPTRACGLVAYATAAVCCAIRWIKPRNGTSGVAATLLFIEGILLLDMAFNWRWKLHQALMDLAQREHEYGQRRLPQTIVLIVLACVLLYGVYRFWRSFRHRGTTLLAVCGTLLSVVLWCTEVVSLHQVDHVLYFSLGGVMSVSLLWFISCGMTSIGILLDPR
jgi:hypothetical protein